MQLLNNDTNQMSDNILQMLIFLVFLFSDEALSFIHFGES